MTVFNDWPPRLHGGGGMPRNGHPGGLEVGGGGNTHN